MSGQRSEGVTASIVPKPWGHEVLWAKTECYVGKVLHVKRGEALSLQYHERKEETLRVLSGLLQLDVGPSREQLETIRLAPGEGWHLPAGTVHRMTALEDTDVLEVSTPELDDVVRLDDRYGRVK